MTESTFTEIAREIADSMRYVDMQMGCDEARSSAWWNNLVRNGTTAVGPPPPDKLSGIAKLFETTPQEVAELVAADWYGVEPQVRVSQRVRRAQDALDSLTEKDFKAIMYLMRRLAEDTEEAA